uniref:Uncharacterized protein LOC105108663 isoform X1 n=1 Tax=Rhizophora mucronata TaxID=61149 RepID=A0A2P2JS01_RHIMU
MAWRSGRSLSRSFISAARAPPIRSSQPLPRLRPPSTATPRLQSRRLSLTPPRNLGELGCFQSFLPLHTTSAAAAHITSRFNSNLRAFCELSHGRNGKDG